MRARDRIARSTPLWLISLVAPAPPPVSMQRRKSAKMTDGSNVSPDTIKEFVGDIRARLADKAIEDTLHKARCDDIRADIKEIKDSAKDAGIPVKVMNETLKKLNLEDKIAALGGKLSADDQT